MSDNVIHAGPGKSTFGSKPKRSGISAARAHAIQSTLKNRLLEIFSDASHFKLTHDDITEKVCKSVLEVATAKRVPSRVFAYIHGVWDTKREDLYNRQIMWVLYLDGRLMTSKEVNALTLEEDRQNKENHTVGVGIHHAYKSPWSRVKSDLCRHVWVDASGAPMYDKPFDRKFLPAPTL